MHHRLLRGFTSWTTLVTYGSSIPSMIDENYQTTTLSSGRDEKALGDGGDQCQRPVSLFFDAPCLALPSSMQLL